jgi:hypothetical protein
VEEYFDFSEDTLSEWSDEHKPNLGDPEKCLGN